MEIKLMQTKNQEYQDAAGIQNEFPKEFPEAGKKHFIRAKRNKKNFPGGNYTWVWMGLSVALVFSLIYIACYDVFLAKSELSTNNTVEQENNIKWLYQNNQILYRDLYNLQNSTNLSYSQLYYPQKEPLENDTVESKDDVMQEAYAEEEVYASVEEALALVDNYFNELETTFSDLNSTYDYMIMDTNKGIAITNTAHKERLDPSNYYFYLSFVYDENGNVTVGDRIEGENSEKTRKTANEVIRTIGLASDNGIANTPYMDFINQYTDKKGPVNCEIIYGITDTIWSAIQSETITDGQYTSNWWNQYAAFLNSGSNQYYYIFLLVVFLIALFIPYADKGQPWNKFKICRIPLEGLAAIGIVLIQLAGSVTTVAVQVATGRSYNSLHNVVSDADDLVYCMNALYLMLLFFGAWYVGICTRGVQEYGVWGYVRKRSLIYRFFPYIKSRSLEFYDILKHFDVTRNAKKLIIKIVLVNAVVLFAISSLWFGGFAITVVYSVLLYFVLKKYVSDLQKKYSILLSATNEIAQGNLNVSIIEDLGVFEPFKPQIIRIQRGFRNAVEEELKSQRMKAELITNVSHDLKTPLTAIITYVGLLKDENITEEQRREYLDTLERKSHRLKVLIEDLFEVSKATSKNVTLNIMDVDIMSLLKQVAFEMSDKLQSANLDIRMNLTDAKVILPLDSQKTYRIYENLFGNIAKYAMPGTRVYVNGFVIDDTVVITMKNITAQEIEVSPEELTDRFVRGDTARNTEGSGLGLAIAKSFTELQNGRLSLEIDGDLFKVTTAWKLQREFGMTNQGGFIQTAGSPNQPGAGNFNQPVSENAGQPVYNSAPQTTTGRYGHSGRSGRSAKAASGKTNTGNTGWTGPGSTGQPITGGNGWPNAENMDQPAIGSTGWPTAGSMGQSNMGSNGWPNAGNMGQSNAGSVGWPNAGNMSQSNAGSTSWPNAGNMGQSNAGSAGWPNAGNMGQSNAGSAGWPNSGNMGQSNAGSVGWPNAGNMGQSITGNAGWPNSGNMGQSIAGSADWAKSGSMKQPAAGSTVLLNAGSMDQSTTGSTDWSNSGKAGPSETESVLQTDSGRAVNPVQNDSGKPNPDGPELI